MMQLPHAFFARPIAHRGLHDITDGRPENSRAAIQAAVDRGYGIELDLQLSADDQAIVFHDYALDRLTDSTGALRQKTAAELAAITLNGSAEGIPSFAEILKLVDGQVPLLIELKDQDGALGEDIGPLEASVASLVADYAGDIALMSFNPHSVMALRNALPLVPRGLTTGRFDSETWATVPEEVRYRLRSIPDFDAVSASFISHDCHDLDRPYVHDLIKKGAPVFTWTVKTPEVEAHVRKIADNITFEGYLA
jgi:glycerophosphoryl diester phosphodiesterase